MTLTQQQQELLKQITNDKFSVGAFSGMIFNTYMERVSPLSSDEDKLALMDGILVAALNVRLRLQELAQ